MSRGGGRVLRALALAVGVLLLGSACSTGTDAVDPTSGGEFRFVQGQAAGEVIAEADRAALPDITATRLDGSRLRLSSLDGDVVVLNFFASWCAPCRVESPEFDAVYQKYKAQGVEFVGVGVKDNADNIKAFVQAKGISYPTVIDPKSEIALRLRDYPTQAIPSTVVVDRHGKVAAVYVAAVAEKDITTTVTALLAES